MTKVTQGGCPRSICVSHAVRTSGLTHKTNDTFGGESHCGIDAEDERAFAMNVVVKIELGGSTSQASCR
jgi:hypothetical protein